LILIFWTKGKANLGWRRIVFSKKDTYMLNAELRSTRARLIIVVITVLTVSLL